MGNQTPQSNTQSSNKCLQSETDFDVHSVVNDLLEAVERMSAKALPPMATNESLFCPENEQFVDQSTIYYDCDKELDRSLDSQTEDLISPLNSLSIDVSHNENDCSSGRSSGSTSVSDWKYTPNYESPNYESVGSKYNDILDSWTLPRDEPRPVKPPRASILRRFDPLISASPQIKSSSNASLWLNQSNDSTTTVTESLLANPKPDLVYIAEQYDRNFEEEISRLKDEIKAKNMSIEAMKESLKKSTENESKLVSLIDIMHLINEELMIAAEEAVKRSTESSEHQWRSKCDQLCEENQELRKKYDSMAEELKKRTNENESIALKCQMKRLQMKLNSIQNELDSKTKENTELSAMVDELILKVRL